MRAALVTASLSHRGGGVSAAVEALSGALLQAGCEVRVFGLADADWTAGERARWRGAEALGLPVAGPRAFGYAPAMLGELLAWRPDFAHSHGLWTHPSRAVLQWARRTGRPYLVSPHGMLDPWALQRARWKKRVVGRLFQDRHLASAAALHALCLAEAAALERYAPGRVLLAPNGVAAPPAAASAPAPWEGRLLAGERVMLFLGRLHEKKNLAPLIRAWGEVPPRERGGWRLAVAGWGQDGHEAELARTAADAGLAGEALFLGPLFADAKDAAFRNASAFVLPSLSEGLPIAVLEAWSYGLPALMSDACNLPEGFQARAALRLGVAPGEMLADLRAFMALDDAAVARLGANARALAAARFRWDAVAAQFIAHYRGVLERAP